MSITSEILENIGKHGHILKVYEAKIGTIECLSIIKCNLNIDEIRSNIAIYNKLFDEFNIKNSPLMEIVDGDKKYGVFLKRVDKLANGEYQKIDSFILGLNYDNQELVIKKLSNLEQILIINSNKIYENTKHPIIKTRKYDRYQSLVISNKTPYLYFYPCDKKRTLSFIIEEIKD